MIRTRICELFEVEHPVLNAPMASAALAPLAAAISAAGGLGMLGGTNTAPDAAGWLRAEIRAVRERTDRPFGVGFISSFPGLEELLSVAIQEGVAVIAHSFADPTPYVGAAHDAGIKVVVQVQTLAQLSQAIRAGVDAVTAQGSEAGGHTGYLGTLPFVAAAVDAAGAVPVIAAGGIADGRGLAAALMLGAEGAWIGTRFAASEEASGEDWQKARIVEASIEETVLTHAYDLATRAPFPRDVGDRVLRNDFTQRWHERDEEVQARQPALATEIAAAARRGDSRIAPIRAGTASGLIGAVEPAGEILRRIIAEAERALRERPGQVLA